MPEDLPGEDNLPQENTGGEEKTTRETCRQIASTQLAALGYDKYVKALSDIIREKEALGELVKIKPDMFGGVKENFVAYAGKMGRVPNKEEALNLLKAAIYGEPAMVGADGTVIISSFSAAEPSIRTIQTKFEMLPGEENDRKYVANEKDADRLVRKLIAGGGFLPESNTVEPIRRLKGGESVSFTHPSTPALKIKITKPETFEKLSESPIAYSYRIQTTLSPTAQNQS